MKTCTECRRSGLSQKEYVPDHDEDVRLVTVEFPVPHQDKNRRTWMCALHRKYYEEQGCKVQSREPKAKCADCRDGEHDDLDHDFRLIVLQDPETMKVVKRSWMCSEHREMYASEYNLIDKTPALRKKRLDPVMTEGRICFGIVWFATESEADEYSKIVRARGDTYNGGFYHGMACGRDKSFDREKNGKKYFAVTER